VAFKQKPATTALTLQAVQMSKSMIVALPIRVCGFGRVRQGALSGLLRAESANSDSVEEAQNG
jgi:hypothetical protein